MRFFCVSLLLIILASCSAHNGKNSKPIDFIPENTEIIVTTKNLEGLKSSFENNVLLQNLSKAACIDHLKDRLKPLSFINASNDVLICLSNENDIDNTDYTFISKYDKSLFKTDSLKDYIEETLKYKSHTITKSTIGESEFYSTILDSIFVLSSSKTIVNNAFENRGYTNSDFEKLYNVSSKNENISLLFKSGNSFLSSFTPIDSFEFPSFD